MDEDLGVFRLICNLAYFYKGAASFEWLENQTVPKLIEMNKQAEKINKAMQRNEGR